MSSTELRAVVVAASSGIGRAAAEALLKAGATVVVNARRRDKLEEIIKDYPKTAFAFPADASKVENLVELVKASKQFFGENKPITSIVWALTGKGFGLFRNLGANKTISDTNEQMEMNVYRLMNLIELVKDDLIASSKTTRGIASVTSVSSVVSKDQIFGGVSYGIGKAALDYLIGSLALEFGSLGVRFNTVNPAVIETSFFDFLGDKKEDLLKDSCFRHVFGRNGKPEEVGMVIEFLASTKASFITGQHIRVDGGNSLLSSVVDVFSPIIADAKNDCYFPISRKWTEAGYFATKS